MVDPNEPFEDLKSWILQLPSVTQDPHRFRGTEFKVEGLEFMHHHGPSFLDIRLSKSDQTTLLGKEQRSLTDSLLRPDGYASGSRSQKISSEPKNSSSLLMKTQRRTWKLTERESNRNLVEIGLE